MPLRPASAYVVSSTPSSLAEAPTYPRLPAGCRWSGEGVATSGLMHAQNIVPTSQPFSSQDFQFDYSGKNLTFLLNVSPNLLILA